MLARIAGIISGGASFDGIILDTFTDADATLIAAHTPDVDTVGGGWSLLDGVGSILGDQVAHTDAGGNEFSIDSGASDVTVTADYTFAIDGLAQGIFLRGTGVTQDHIACVIASAGTSNPALRIVVNGTIWTNLALTGEGPFVGETWPMSITANGTTISVSFTVNGTEYTDSYVTTTFQTETHCGITGHGATALTDNFTVVAS
jgi:hypothetical protein